MGYALTLTIDAGVTDLALNRKGSRLCSHVVEAFWLDFGLALNNSACGNEAGWWRALIKIQIMNLWFEYLNCQCIMFHMPRSIVTIIRSYLLVYSREVELELGVNFFTTWRPTCGALSVHSELFTLQVDYVWTCTKRTSTLK